jgi:hypothetical protein
MEVVMRAQLLALAMCVIGCGGSGTPDAKNVSQPVTDPAGAAGAAGGTSLAGPTVPAEIAVPEGHNVAFMTGAKGVQIYECVAAEGGALAWKLRAPRAELTDASGAVIGSHYGGVDKSMPPGPYWESSDGSRVHAGKPVTAPNPGSIPLLRLEATDVSGTGVFSKVAFIHRVETTGGVAPDGACTAGKTTEVPYTATYYFYEKATGDQAAQ